MLCSYCNLHTGRCFSNSPHRTLSLAGRSAGGTRVVKATSLQQSTRFGKFCPSRRQADVSASAKPDELEGDLVSSRGVRYGVVVARFNDLVTKLLLDGCLDTFKRHGAIREDIDVAWVPGSFELPVVAQSMAKSGQYGAVVAIGVIVRGATAHYDAVVGAATSGCLAASTNTGVPVIFGVLTTDDMDQALDRAGGKVGNKGGEAAGTAIEMANLLSTMRSKGMAAQPW